MDAMANNGKEQRMNTGWSNEHGQARGRGFSLVTRTRRKPPLPGAMRLSRHQGLRLRLNASRSFDHSSNR